MPEQLIEKADKGKIACFGKIRAKGDFVSRNLDYQVQEFFDQWLQSAFNISQEQIGDEWLKHYLTSPIWRFVISHGGMNKDIVGFMMPSIDKVGRYYPLFMLEVFDDGKLSGDELNCKNFEELEELAMSTLDLSNNSSNFFDALNQTGFPLFEEQPPVSELIKRLSFQESEIDQKTMHYLWQEPSNYSSFEFGTTEASENEEASKVSGIWWTEGSETMDKTLVFCNGLPPMEGYSAMLDGGWEQWGWQNKINKEEDESFAAE